MIKVKNKHLEFLEESYTFKVEFNNKELEVNVWHKQDNTYNDYDYGVEIFKGKELLTEEELEDFEEECKDLDGDSEVED